ncbi:MAG: 50S ribosomal protein L18 [Chloroflexota bacterium]|nr:50S ribosomal protein L18 [Chloroflexota bacterium]
MAAHARRASRLRRHRRLRTRIRGTAERPRLAVFRSLQHTYAQVIDDARGVTLAAASTLEADIGGGSRREQASGVGRAIAERAKALKLSQVVFDRGGFAYAGRVKAVADAARADGLEF